MLAIAREIAQAAADRRFKVLIVGGFVRDRILGIASKDLDCEIYGATLPEIKEFLSQFGDVEINHDARFPVFRLSMNGVALEFCPPRRDRKVAPGPKGFEVSIDPHMTPREACSRRHYSVGAMAYDPLTGEIIDPFLGKDDLLSGILRATDKRYFADDPLRVYIGFQLAGRFDLVATQDTLDMARQMLDEEYTIHVNAKWLEWEKWAQLSMVPSRGMWFLMHAGWLHLHPELSDLVGCEQELSHHPEGEAFTHTLLVVDAMTVICNREAITGEDKVVLVLAALLHDVGKPSTTEFNEEKGHITSYGHDIAGIPITEKFLVSIGAPRGIINRVLPLVGCHMRHVNFHTGGQVVERHARRLAKDLEPATVREWALVVEADANGRTPRQGGLPESAAEMLRLARELAIEDAAPLPILMGRHLIDLGMAPGPQFGRILKKAYEAQLDGEFEDLAGAIEWKEKIDDSTS